MSMQMKMNHLTVLNKTTSRKKPLTCVALNCANSPRKNKGFSLMEVLASSVILSIGLLGLASLHFEGLKKSNESFHKTMASFHAGDLMERMRANLDAVDQGFYDNQSAQTTTQSNLNCLGGIDNGDWSPSNYEGMTEMQCNEKGTVCTEIQSYNRASGTFSDAQCNQHELAQQDLYEWQKNLANMLPGGDSTVCRTSNPGEKGSDVQCDNKGNLILINISWQSKSGGTHEYRVTFKP